jgi:acyl carrier protein
MTPANSVGSVWTFPTENESVFAQFYDATGAVVATIVEDQLVLTDHPVPTFSQECRRDAGLPWNLIPKQVVVHSRSLPRSASGAAETDQAAVKEIVQYIVHGTVQSSKDILESLLRDVFRLSQNDEIDVTKSFVELGGDSASAVTFLYQLRRKFDINLHAVDILRCARLCELKAAIAKLYWQALPCRTPCRR